jgi:hypothetical protein
MVSCAGLCAACAGLLVHVLGRNAGAAARAWIAVGVACAFLPHLPWHNVLWGFQSQVYWVLLASVGALELLMPGASTARTCAGLAAGGAALLAMGAGAFVPLALLGLARLPLLEHFKNVNP